jgi:hypothetical protein
VFPFHAQYLDLWPDRNNLSCMASFNHSWTANFVGRANVWRHIAVTWTSRGNGRTRIYQDGLLMAEVSRLGGCRPVPLLAV